MPAAAITTLQRCSRFKNLFDQLELTANEQRIATEVLVNIALRAGVNAWRQKSELIKPSYKTLTRSLSAIKIGYSNHGRPLYLVASIN